jgi:hypothetical protein
VHPSDDEVQHRPDELEQEAQDQPEQPAAAGHPVGRASGEVDQRPRQKPELDEREHRQQRHHERRTKRV